ncbi:MAG: FecR family protein [Mucilaginibacter sp.]|uniref:FecR family protein n=1 Tax=Mucilaginibacter sp. TaxID=1882438 RepID=UPI00326476FB
MNRQNFLELLTLKISGELSAPQQQQFDEALASNKEYQLIADGLLYDAPQEVAEPEQLQSIWDNIAIAENEPEKKFRYSFPVKYFVRIAVAVVIMISAGILWQKYHAATAPTQSLSINAANHKLYQTLDDGTTIYLNNRSVIHYNADFGKAKREISLQGEAFFDVTKNADVPLFIHVGAITIEVKGTAFNVLEHREQKQVEIALIRGKIEVSGTPGQDKNIPLNPHQKMIVSATSYQILALDTIKQAATLQWTRDSLVFKKEKLINLVILLERKYQVKIEIHNEKLKLKQFSGVIKNEQLTEALDALKLSYPFNYAISNKTVIIK